MEISVDFIIDNDVAEPNGFVQTAQKKTQPPPIYIQIRSLLI
jgi:hypothetical protein